MNTANRLRCHFEPFDGLSEQGRRAQDRLRLETYTIEYHPITRMDFSASLEMTDRMGPKTQNGCHAE